MAPTYSTCQEMVSIYLIKVKITTKSFQICNFGGIKVEARYDVNQIILDISCTSTRCTIDIAVKTIRVRNLKFTTYLKFATCGITNKLNELR